MLTNKFDAVYSQNDASIGIGDLCSKLWVFPMSELLLFSAHQKPKTDLNSLSEWMLAGVVSL
jgi:hypothetical protein